jgi:SAM-dependent methyltransferase
MHGGDTMSPVGGSSAPAGEGQFPVRSDAGLAALWEAWVDHTRAAMHINHEGTGDDLNGHMEECLIAADAQFDDAFRRLGSALAQPVHRILEVGCSNGFKPFALQRRFPNAEIFGVDLDADAIALAQGMAARLDPERMPRVPTFVEGVGEDLPFEDSSFDLVICLTTIEHVADVDRVLAEIARVLRGGGVLYLEAPNYLWPYESHVGAVMPPLCPKPLLRLLLRLQGKAGQVHFVDHLKFVHPHWLERDFDALGLTWRNVYLEKMREILSGKSEAIAYRRLGGILRLLDRLHLASALMAPFVWAGIYPSVMYVATKPTSAGTSGR